LHPQTSFLALKTTYRQPRRSPAPTCLSSQKHCLPKSTKSETCRLANVGRNVCEITVHNQRDLGRSLSPLGHHGRAAACLSRGSTCCDAYKSFSYREGTERGVPQGSRTEYTRETGNVPRASNAVQCTVPGFCNHCFWCSSVRRAGRAPSRATAGGTPHPRGRRRTVCNGGKREAESGGRGRRG